MILRIYHFYVINNQFESSLIMQESQKYKAKVGRFNYDN